MVAELEVATDQGATSRVPLLVGRDTGSTVRKTDPTGGTLQVVRPWSWAGEGDPVDYLAEIALPSGELSTLAIVNVRENTVFRVRALTLIDERDGATTSLVLDDRIERTEFFDMKVYEFPEVLSRAYLVHRAIEATDDQALARLGEADFDPHREAIVEPGAGLPLETGRAGEWVTIEEDRPERVRVRVFGTAPGLLVLSDAYAPGWTVSVDGSPARLLRANVALRGVFVPAGEHEIVFNYEPSSFRLGALLSLGCMISVLAPLVVMPRWRSRERFRTARGSELRDEIPDG
jgi:hypothetical protein